MKKDNSTTSVKILSSTLDRINKKRVRSIDVKDDGSEKVNYVKHDAFQLFLLDSLEILEGTAKGAIKAELHLKKFLVFGHDRVITPSEIRLSCGVNLNTCKVVMAKYKNDIENFNSNF